MVNIWMREDGLAIDKFVITSDPDFVPTGVGPDVTDGTEDYVRPSINNDPIVVDPVEVDTTYDDPIVEAPTNNEPLDSDTTETDNLVSGDNDVGSGDPVVAEGSSSNGLFGGSSSIAGLLALFALCLVRVGRSKRVCLG